MLEEWRDCHEVEALYSVSSLGRIRNKKTGRIIKTFKSRLGYYDCYLYLGVKPKKRIIRKVHRLVALAFKDNPNGYAEVDHVDGNKSNNSSGNLQWCSRSGNMSNAFKTGLIKAKSGEMNPTSKLDWNKVREIRKLRENMTLVKLAEKFGVTAANISEICNYKTWKE